MKLEQVVEILRINKTPFLYLYVKKGITNAVLVAKFDCATCQEDDTPEEKTEKAIVWLEKTVELFPNDTLFILKAKTSEKANQSGIIGPIEFVKSVIESNPNSLSGLDTATLKGLGYIPEAELKAAIAQQQLEFYKQIHRQELERLRNDFSQQLEFIKQAQASWDPKNVAQLVNELKDTIALIFGKKNEQPQTLQNDPKTLLIQSIVNELKNYDIEQLKQFKIALTNVRQKSNSGATSDRTGGETSGSTNN